MKTVLRIITKFTVNPVTRSVEAYHMPVLIPSSDKSIAAVCVTVIFPYRCHSDADKFN
jgi:hypothetical protein